ncbi:hypothetical protein ACFQ60_00820 [Streptomyces zhihengii]
MLPEQGAMVEVLTEEITGGDVPDRQMRGEKHGLRALASSGRSEEEDAHRCGVPSS